MTSSSIKTWKEFEFSEIFDFSSGLSKAKSEFGFGHPFLSFKDVFYNYYVSELPTELANTSEKERNSNSVLKGDIFLTRTSESSNELGMSCVALKDFKNTTFNGFTKRLRLKNKSFDLIPEYSAFFFRSNYFRNQIDSFVSMTTRASLNNEILGRLKILVPPKEEQNKIAVLMMQIDRKISLNNKICTSLEEIVNTTFRSWFIDFLPAYAKGKARDAGYSLDKQRDIAMGVFLGVSDVDYYINNFDECNSRLKNKLKNIQPDIRSLLIEVVNVFPGEFTNSSFGEIPKGWDVLRFSTFLSPRKERVPNADVPEFSITNTGIFPRNDKFKKKLSANSLKNKLILKGDLGFGMSRKILNWGVMEDEQGGVSSAYHVYKVDNSIVDSLYLKFFIKERINYFMDLIKPSSREGQALDREALVQKEIYLPDPILLEKAMSLRNSAKELIYNKTKQNSILLQLRTEIFEEFLAGNLEFSKIQKHFNEVSL